MSRPSVVAAAVLAGLAWWGIQDSLDAPPPAPPTPHAVTTHH